MKKIFALLLVLASLMTGPFGVSANGGNEDFDDLPVAWPVSV